MALKDKILMVSIYPSHTETPLNVPDVEKRVDAFVERLRKVSEQEDAIIVFDRATPTEPCSCDDMRRMFCKCRDAGKCTCPHLKCGSCRAMARIDAYKYAEELTSLYAAHAARLNAASTTFLSMATLQVDFARDTNQPMAPIRRL